MYETQDIQQDMHHTSFIAIIFKNLLYLLVFLFTPVLNYMIAIFPNWKDSIENFKLIGGAVIVAMVIFKLLLEIIKLLKKKK